MKASKLRTLEIRGNVESAYPDVFTPAVREALESLAPFDDGRESGLARRIERRASRARHQQRIAFLDPVSTIARTTITVQAARDGAFVGSDSPRDLERQWIQGTGPAAKQRAPIE